MAKVRLNMEVSEDVAKLLDTLADQEGVTRTEIVRRALSVLKVYRAQIDAGRPHMGFVKESSRLDAELVGVLTAPEQSKSAKPVPATTG